MNFSRKPGLAWLRRGSSRLGAWAAVADPCNSRRPPCFAACAPSPAGAKKKIPIGVFDPVYDHLSLDEMLDKVSALGLEAMEIGTGGYPNNRHCPLDDLIAG